MRHRIPKKSGDAATASSTSRFTILQSLFLILGDIENQKQKLKSDAQVTPDSPN